jgi:transcriptional regulator with XRE-family HTH domain
VSALCRCADIDEVGLIPIGIESINSLIRVQADRHFFAWEEVYRMSSQSMTFGRAIAAARKAKGLSQKELAASVLKEEGEGCISPQYLNDIEHDRRSPTSDHLIRQFARVLDEDEGYLFVLAGKIPDDLRQKVRDRDKVVSGFANFRKNISGR